MSDTGLRIPPRLTKSLRIDPHAFERILARGPARIPYLVYESDLKRLVLPSGYIGAREPRPLRYQCKLGVDGVELCVGTACPIG